MSSIPTIDRRRLLQGLGGLGLAGALSACVGPTITRGGSGSTAKGAGNAALLAAVDSKPATGTVSFAHWRAEDKAVFDTLIAAFTKANPDAKVTQDISPSNDYQSTALQKIKGGNIGNAFTAFRGAQFVNMTKAGLYAGLGAQPFVDNYYAELVKAGQEPAAPSWACHTSWCSTCRSTTRTPSPRPGSAPCPPTGTASWPCATP